MRFFGVFAAFTAITAVFAAPVPAPAPIPEVDSVAIVKARDLTDDINNILCALKYDLEQQLMPLFNQTLADAESDMDSFVGNIPGLLTQLIGSITGAATQAGLTAVEDIFKFKEKRTAEEIEKRSISIQQIGSVIQDIEQIIADLLCKIATAIQDQHPDIAATLQEIISVMNTLTTALGEVCTDLSPYLQPISDILGGLGFFNIPGFH
jgi:predicted PurR-regulated permease PerM